MTEIEDDGFITVHASRGEKMIQEHPTLPVPGYKPQPQNKVDIVTDHKEMEELILRKLDLLRDQPPEMVDQAWLQIGRQKMEEAWMAINRSIFQPGRATIRNEAVVAAVADGQAVPDMNPTTAN